MSSASMNKVQERIPWLLSQARTRACRPHAAAVSLRSAEELLLSVRRDHDAGRWLWNSAAQEIAATWRFITGDPDQAESCLRRLIGAEGNTRAWTEVARQLRIVLGAKWFDRTWDCRTRKYLLMAEEMAHSCQDWCDCATAWRSESSDKARAMSCLIRAEGAASSFHDFVACASVLRQHFSEYGWSRLRGWAAMASASAVTSRDWLMCAELVAEVDEFETRRCLLEAVEKAGTTGAYIVCALRVDQLTEVPEHALVMRCLALAERCARDVEDWRQQVLAGYTLRFRAARHHDSVASADSWEDFDEHYRQSLRRFRAIPPRTQDWLALVKRLRWRPADATDVDFMLSAEAAALSSQDWMDCATVWTGLNLPDARKNASLCRLRGLTMEKPLHFPHDGD